MDRFGRRIGHRLGNTFDWTTDERDMAIFSLTLMFSTAFFVFVLIALSTTVGVFKEAAAIAATAGLLKAFAGGPHFSTGWRCGLVSAAGVTTTAWLCSMIGNAGDFWFTPALPGIAVAVSLGTAAVMARRAPVEVPEKPIASRRQRKRLRRIAVAIPLGWGAIAVGLWSFFYFSNSDFTELFVTLWMSSASGLLWETFSTLPPGTRLVQNLERRIERMLRSMRQSEKEV